MYNRDLQEPLTNLPITLRRSDPWFLLTSADHLCATYETLAELAARVALHELLLLHQPQFC
jgi:hypothetical protein